MSSPSTQRQSNHPNPKQSNIEHQLLFLSPMTYRITLFMHLACNKAHVVAMVYAIAAMAPGITCPSGWRIMTTRTR
ncbi:hypothetical protein LX36DRAFT_399515 [Colletotrichum falcatum]|nr:hypothetical protein LX36DRAFT_399515 [Colletotrichum falcatum]